MPLLVTHCQNYQIGYDSNDNFAIAKETSSPLMCYSTAFWNHFLAENQKGIIIQRCSIQNQKAAIIAIDFVQQ